jgi:anti-sigma factor RsiW
MNCDESTALLGAHADGELDGLRSHALARHLAGCGQCAPRYAALLDLQRRLRGDLPRYPAPAALRTWLQAELSTVRSEPPAQRATPGGRWRWFGAGTLAGGLATGLLCAAFMAWPPGGADGDVSERLVGLHTRATLGNHLVEIASSDRHQVKPWLSARLDYTIPVADWAAFGFPLAGARIERFDRLPTATLVYRHRNHVIDVVVRPQTGSMASADVHAVRGFNVAAAQGAQMNWWAISDLNAADLEAFVQGLARGQVAPSAE